MGLLEYIGSIGGIAGVLAAIIFLTYKNMVKQLRDDRKYMEDRLTEVIHDYNEAVQANTKISAELFTWLKAKNGHN